MTTQNLLIELFVEELPPKALKKLGIAFASTLFEQLQSQGLTQSDATFKTYATPRRLAALIQSVHDQAPSKQVSTKLMPVSVGLGPDGQAMPALVKKLQAMGLNVSDPVPLIQQLRQANDGKTSVLYLDRQQEGVSLAEGLQKALNETLTRLPIPKVMQYQLQANCEWPGWSSVSFVRPVHGLIALHGTDIVDVTVLGMQAGRCTKGHRFESKSASLQIMHADQYAQTLLQEGAVIASYEERSLDMIRQLRERAKACGAILEIEANIQVNSDHEIEQALLEHPLVQEVTALVERPNVLVCQFEKQFLSVPQECLILTMKANQKYFPLFDGKGKLTNQFLIVSNIRPEDPSAVIGGNERVVRPRLADAQFFFDQDRKRTLESRVDGLSKVIYHGKLGTQIERMHRVRGIAHVVVEMLRAHAVPYTAQVKEEFDMLAHKADQAARLAKTDLLTDMVAEFPELQGTMGGYYARHDGLRDGVAIAIEDHYKPRFAGDELPRNRTGTVVALADKLETLVGMFGIGNLPTGDKDPFALRRHALGVLRMLLEKQLPLPLPQLLKGSHQVFGDKLPALDDPQAQQALVALEQFMLERLSGLLREQGHGAQEIDAVLGLQTDSIAEVPKRLMAVRSFAALTESAALAAANKRISNILKKAQSEGAEISAQVNEDQFTEPAEHQLFQAMQTLLPKSDKQFQQGDYTACLQTLSALRSPVDAFFDHVMVNAEQPQVRINRLGLLKQLHKAMNRVADLSRLAG